MRSSRALLALLSLFFSAHLKAAQVESISGTVKLTPYPNGGVSVYLEISSSEAKESIHLNVDSTSRHVFHERFPPSLKGTDFLVRVEVGSPSNVFSDRPDYVWRRGRPFDLVLLKRSDAFQNWLKSARRADRLDQAIQRLQALEDWSLEPVEKLQVTMQKADSYERWNQPRKQQELLRDVYDELGFQSLPNAVVADYFRQRLGGFARLIGGDFPSILNDVDRRSLWERLLSDFADQYSACDLDAAVAAASSQWTSEIIAVQHKTLRTWLGRFGKDVGQCGSAPQDRIADF